MSNISTIAKQFNVSENALRGFAQSVILSMKADSVDDAFLLMNEADRIELVEAYSMAAIKKMQTFTNKYFSDPQAADQFRAAVKSLL